MDRRTFLQSSTVLGGSLLAWDVNHAAAAATARIDVPVVDRLVVREITDGAHDIFLRGVEVGGLAVQRTGHNGAEGQDYTASGVWRCISNCKKAARRGAIFWISATRPTLMRIISII